MDADCVRQEKTKKIEELAAKLKIPIIWIHINPPEEFILNKLKNFQHTWLFKDAEDAIRNYEVRKQLHKNLHSDFAYTFDPSRSDLTDQIEEAISIIKRGMSVTL
jgi:predicted kinase